MKTQSHGADLIIFHWIEQRVGKVAHRIAMKYAVECGLTLAELLGLPLLDEDRQDAFDLYVKEVHDQGTRQQKLELEIWIASNGPA